MDINSNNGNFPGIESEGADVISRGRETIGEKSLGEVTMSRGTMLTDKWRALNADLFDMKLQVKINEPPHPNTITNRIGVL